MPKVSVIIPSYNHAQFLETRIESVLTQSNKDWELIILDDASTDGSREIIESYVSRYPQIRAVFNENNSGSPFYQWNKGAEIADGTYLWFAESDDSCESNFLETMIPILDSNPNVGIAYAQSYLINEEGEKLNSYKKNLEFIYKANHWDRDFVKSGKEACREWLLFHNPIPNASGALIRKQNFLDCGMAPTEMVLNGDWFLYTKILCDSDLAFHAGHLNLFRVHPATQRVRSRVSAMVYKEIIRINEYIREHVAHSDENANAAIRKISTWWQGNLYYQERTKENKNLNKELYRYFSKYRKNLRLHIWYTYLIEITRSFMRSTGLIKPAKRIRSVLFPGKYFES